MSKIDFCNDCTEQVLKFIKNKKAFVVDKDEFEALVMANEHLCREARFLSQPSPDRACSHCPVKDLKNYNCSCFEKRGKWKEVIKNA